MRRARRVRIDRGILRVTASRRPQDDGTSNKLHAPAGPQSALRFAVGAARHRAEAGKAVRPAVRRATASGRASSICCFICRPASSTAATSRNSPRSTPDTVVTVAVTVDRHRPPPPNRPRAPYNIDASDDTNTLTITYFNARQDYLEKLFPEGELRYVSGTATLYDGHLQMVHPDRVVDAKGFASLPLIDPVYPLTEGLHPNQVRKAMDARARAAAGAAGMAGCGLALAQRFPSFADALRAHPSARPRRTISRRKARPGRGSPMTNCSRASSRWRCLRAHMRATRRPRQRRRRPAARAHRRRRCPMR